MGKWQQKLSSGTYPKGTAKTAKSPPGPDRATADFLRLVRITAICERGLVIEDERILAELDAEDLAELRTSDRYDKQCWAQMLAHRLCDERNKRGLKGIVK